MSAAQIVVLIFGALALFVALLAWAAPEGWQDAAGFHVGRADLDHDRTYTVGGTRNHG